MPGCSVLYGPPRVGVAAVVRWTVVASLLGLSACAPAAAPSATLAPTAVPPTLAPATAPTLAPATAAVPLPTIAAVAWTPAPRTKTTGCVSQGGLPDPACTPGAIDPRVTPATATTTICTSGYTATVRPPVTVTDRIKRDQMAAYGIEGQPPNSYELDHLISLELGGAPADVANLWPQPWEGGTNAHQKDAVETHLKQEVCRGAVALLDAQRMIATDWLAVYREQHLTPTH
jgi:hypothetical protein